MASLSITTTSIFSAGSFQRQLLLQQFPCTVRAFWIDRMICRSSSNLQAHFSPVRSISRIRSLFSSQNALKTFTVSLYADAIFPHLAFMFFNLCSYYIYAFKIVNMFFRIFSHLPAFSLSPNLPNRCSMTDT